MTKTIRFELLNETPGAYRYQEVDADGTPLLNDGDGASIGALYLRKAKFDSAPAFITVTVEGAVEESAKVVEKAKKLKVSKAKTPTPSDNPFALTS